MFRKFLIRIRREYNTEKTRFYTYTLGALVVLLAVSVAVDILLPFKGPSTILRSLIALVFSAVIFTLGYSTGLYLHRLKKEEDETWQPYRLRFSLNWRRRISIIAGSILFVFIYATGTTPVYTTMSSAYIAIILGLIAFIRPTHQETIREELNIPDIRDVRYEEYMKNLKKERTKAARKSKSKSKKTDDEDDYFEDDEYVDELED